MKQIMRFFWKQLTLNHLFHQLTNMIEESSLEEEWLKQYDTKQQVG